MTAGQISPEVWSVDELAALLNEPMYRFRPRPDCPEEFDQQTGFLNSRAKVAVAMGGNRCLGGETELFDPMTNTTRRIDEIDWPFHVWSLDQYAGRYEIAAASAPWVKGRDKLYRFTLSNGQSFVATMGHRVLLRNGEWASMRNVVNAYSEIKSADTWRGVRVESVKYLRHDSYYDLSVPGNENYLCAGIWHHNSGKTETAAQKAARFMLCQQDPPRPDTPFMVISDTYHQVGQICWKEKLSRILPKSSIDWSRITWYSTKEGLPYVVPLVKRRDTGHNWSIEFRSLDQGRQHFQGRSFGGFWFSEQFDFEIFEEVLRGCSDYWYDGAQFAEFTPVDPDLSVAIEERMDQQPAGWEFFRLNTLKNNTLAAGFTDTFFGTVSPELLATRQTGAIPTFLGSVYPNFNPSIHLLDEVGWRDRFGARAPERYCDASEFKRLMPANWFFRRGVDWGESVEHPFICLWGMKDGSGNWVIFDEYVEDTGTVMYSARREEIKLRWPWRNGDAHFGQTYADPSRPMLIQEFNQDKIPTSAANNAVHDGIEYVRKSLAMNRITKQPGLTIYKPNCPRLIKELRKYRWVRGVDGGRNPHVANLAPLKWQDDCCDALRYLVYSDRVRFAGAMPMPAILKERRHHGVLLDKPNGG
jgi:hypothetical protein